MLDWFLLNSPNSTNSVNLIQNKKNTIDFIGSILVMKIWLPNILKHYIFQANPIKAKCVFCDSCTCFEIDLGLF